MNWATALQIGTYIFGAVGVILVIWQTGRALKARDQAFRDLGTSWSLGLGTCLSGLPGLEQPAMVTCGGNATELIFLADEDDNREICRIPWGAILQIFGGNEAETRLHLGTLDGLPSLILAQEDHRRRDGKYYVPSYTVIDWTDSAAHRKQTVFELGGPQLGSFKANYLTAKKMTPGYSSSRSLRTSA